MIISLERANQVGDKSERYRKNLVDIISFKMKILMLQPAIMTGVGGSGAPVPSTSFRQIPFLITGN